MTRGGKGVRISIMSILPVNGEEYLITRMRVPARLGSEPRSPEAAVLLWLEYVDSLKMQVKSSLRRRLQSGHSHVDKVLKQCVDRKINVLVIPRDLRMTAPNGLFIEKVATEFERLSHFEKGEFGQPLEDLKHPLQRYQTWLLDVVPGGVFRLKPYQYRTAIEYDPLIMAWLQLNHKYWRGNLQVWRDTKEEYMQDYYKKTKVPYEVAIEIAALISAGKEDEAEVIKDKYRGKGRLQQTKLPGERRPLKKRTTRQDKAGTSKWAKEQE